MTTITFYDKKLIDTIRNHITLRSKQGVDEARALDNPEQTLSGLAMLFIEKLLQGKSLQDIVEKDLNGLNIINKFYKQAQNDNDFLSKNHLTLIHLHFNSLERKVAECIPFIWILQQHLENTEEIEQPAKIRDMILEIAAEHKIEKGNPLLITALAALYGHPQARNIIKKDVAVVTEKVATPLSQSQIEMIYLMLLPEVVATYSKQIWQGENQPESVYFDFYTANTEFNAYVSALDVTAYPLESTEGWECEYGMGLTTDFFPYIANDEKEMLELINKIS